jgi:hypothetical protein
VLFDEQRNFSAEGGWKPVFGRHFEGPPAPRRRQPPMAPKGRRQRLQGGAAAAYLDIFASNNEPVLQRWSGRSLDVYELAQQLTFANGYAAFLGRDRGWRPATTGSPSAI